jgi:hypothetical protein
MTGGLAVATDDESNATASMAILERLRMIPSPLCAPAFVPRKWERALFGRSSASRACLQPQ